MAKSLKTLGLEEAQALQSRVRRQFALSRINREDYDFLESQLSKFVTRVKEMEEKDDRDAP